MAFSHVTAALDIGNLTPGCKLLLVVLALDCDYRGHISTDYRHLGKRTGLTSRSLLSHLQKLEDRMMLVRIEGALGALQLVLRLKV